MYGRREPQEENKTEGMTAVQRRGWGKKRVPLRAPLVLHGSVAVARTRASATSRAQSFSRIAFLSTVSPRSLLVSSCGFASRRVPPLIRVHRPRCGPRRRLAAARGASWGGGPPGVGQAAAPVCPAAQAAPALGGGGAGVKSGAGVQQRVAETHPVARQMWRLCSICFSVFSCLL